MNTRLKLVLFFLLALPRPDPLCFSAHSGRSLIPDPGAPLCFSAQSGGSVTLPQSWESAVPLNGTIIGVFLTELVAVLSVLLIFLSHLW